MLAENFEQSTIAWNGLAAKTEVRVAKPWASFGEEDIPLTYGTVSSTDFPLREYGRATSCPRDSLSKIHLSLQTTDSREIYARIPAEPP